MRPHDRIRVLSLLSLLLPAAAHAQDSSACTDGEPLFQCSFEQTKSVAVCLANTTITYDFGPENGRPELSLRSDIADIDYTPYDWGTDTIFESVKFYNGETSYEVFTTRPRIPDPGGAEGGIVVTLPGQAPVTLACDSLSVRPYDPMDGIGKLAYFTIEDGATALASCLVGADQATSCLGTIHRLEQSDNGCIVGHDQTDCWAAEAAAWEAQLTLEVTIAVEAMKSMQFSPERIQASQESWYTTRELDCAIKTPLLFAADGGEALCYAEYAAKRIDFLRGVASDAEFQG